MTITAEELRKQADELERKEKEQAQRREQEREQLKNFKLGDLQPGSYVLARSGYSDHSLHVRKVIKVTKNQIITDSYSDKPLRFNRVDGYEIGGSKWYRTQLVGTPTQAQAEQHELSILARQRMDRENERIKNLCEAAKAKLLPLLGPNVKVMRWTTREDGTASYKIEVENMTEADIQHITAFWAFNS